METNFELEFVSLKSPVSIAIAIDPPSFSKRVFRTSFEKGGGAKRRRIWARWFQNMSFLITTKNLPNIFFKFFQQFCCRIFLSLNPQFRNILAHLMRAIETFCQIVIV